MENRTILVNDSSLEDNPWYISVRSIQTMILPFVCVGGFIGNILAAGTFLSKSLRKTSCCLYLASKAVSDICFLISLVVIWLYRLDVPVFEIVGVCQATVFVAYISSFLSVWFVVLITWENFIRVSLPGHVPKLCSVQRAKYTIFILFTVSFGIYSFSFWTTGLISKEKVSSCLVIEKYELLLAAMTCVDSILTLVIPLIIMVFLNISIAIRTIHAVERRKRLYETAQMTSRRRPPTVIEMKVSRLLFAVSTIFILLHTPSHVIRLKMMVLQNIHLTSPNLSDMILHRIFEVIYYLNFSVHIAVYVTFGEQFRMVFRRIYCSTCTEKPNAQPYVITTYKETGSEAEAMLQ